MKDRKVGMGWNRRREQGNEAYPLRTDVGGVGADIEKSLLGLDSRAGTKKVGFREGGHDTHTDTQTYIYIYASSVATRCYPVGCQVLQLEGFKMLSGFYVAYAVI